MSATELHFVHQKTHKSYCDKCHTTLDLLIEDSLSQKHLIMFYICWPCKRIIQVGKGVVPRQ